MAKDNRTTAAPSPHAALDLIENALADVSAEDRCQDIIGLGHRVRLAGELLNTLSLDAPPDRPEDPQRYQQQAAWGQAGFLADTLEELGRRISDEAETVSYSVGGDQ